VNGTYSVVRVIARLNVGGPAIHVINLSEGLQDRFPTLLVAGRVDPSEGDMTDAARERDLDLFDLEELGRRIHAWQDLVAFVKLYRLFRRVRPTIVHTHTAKAGTLGRIAAVLAGVPIRVHTFHGHVLRGYFPAGRTRLVIRIERLLARFTTKIVTVSEGQARELVEEFGICPREKMEVISLGFDLSRFPAASAERLGAEFRAELGAGDAPVIAIVGRLVPIKNHDLLLEAVAELERRGREFVLAIVGGGPEEARLRRRVGELGLAARVRFVGWRSDLDRVYGGSDIVALTSVNEGTPVCLIEALAAGRPVVATDVGGVRDVLDGGRLGTIVPPGDPLGFADALDELLADAERRRALGRAGSVAVRSTYGIDRLLDSVSRLYDRLLTEQRSVRTRSSPLATTS
jgi:glycosyltransferase involved in cell wall biosynthesis